MSPYAEGPFQFLETPGDEIVVQCLPQGATTRGLAPPDKTVVVGGWNSDMRLFSVLMEYFVLAAWKLDKSTCSKGDSISFSPFWSIQDTTKYVNYDFDSPSVVSIAGTTAGSGGCNQFDEGEAVLEVDAAVNGGGSQVVSTTFPAAKFYSEKLSTVFNGVYYEASGILSVEATGFGDAFNIIFSPAGAAPSYTPKYSHRAVVSAEVSSNLDGSNNVVSADAEVIVTRIQELNLTIESAIVGINSGQTGADIYNDLNGILVHDFGTIATDRDLGSIFYSGNALQKTDRFEPVGSYEERDVLIHSSSEGIKASHSLVGDTFSHNGVTYLIEAADRSSNTDYVFLNVL